ncbi:uncharacterized protein LOC126881012 isoform X2 [Diabrotica virgifera virgifera]|uniref:Uncharacterized protein LOC114338169 isoform X2 n=1 Tax=Diabrotica virgifera virgifera TaxID=50390 RepID=A0A6P7G667_DIAVI|nr:uncharacterized protein LOC126881012 isoform X2 [Diabrotica virgifera virgifera]
MGVSILLFLVTVTFICVNSQLQQYQYALPDYSLQNVEPNYNQLLQQQVPYYLQAPQEQTYYPVSQQQPVYPTNGLSNVYPTNGQGVYYPYPYQYAVPDQPQFTSEQLQQIALQQLPQSLVLPQQIGNAKNNTEPQPVAVKTEQPNSFANVKTEIIDLNPQDFRRVMQRLNARPIIVSYERRVVGSGSGRPHYTVTTNSKQTNETDVPKSIETYKTTSKPHHSFLRKKFNKSFPKAPLGFEYGSTVVSLVERQNSLLFIISTNFFSN